MYQITYKNFLIDRAYSKTGKTTYFKSIKKAKQFIESEQSE